ncbi:type 1 glutamine amidotransferase domain-containing protein [Sinomonas sp. ASV486]|uniref:type 1 glutamine amidotransferase domain-containing protein n=1 Tax=Sinomonas sp. ASV486 TaxID=3051170 RepID=UPI0027DC401E|nr:type 1 glutamine amidotransferase domain-containing protein [Sinomonas sp. ASV486]MDQ4490406.1 type 1 glutamine amidotransferase domain-containing protein [Sinomonas sp. ASV486]
MAAREYGVIPQAADDRAPRAVVLSADAFEDLELYVPVFRLVEAGWTVDIAAPEKGKITGESNWYYIMANKSIDEIDPDGYDLLVIPGGKPHGAPTTVRNNSHAREIARSFFAKDKPVAAICHGPYLLVSAGVVEGRRLTSYWGDGVPEEITAAGGQWEDADVVIDGNLVTSRWPMDIAAFSREMMKLVSDRG